MSLLSRLRRYPWARSARFAWQRLTRGWDDSVTWSLDHEIAKWVLPRFRRFRELEHGHPIALTPDEWEHALDEIEWFLSIHTDGAWNINGDPVRYEKAARLFGEHLGDLWS